MEDGPFEDAFPIENGDIPASYVSLLEGIHPLDHVFQASLDSALDGEIQLPKTPAFLKPRNPLISTGSLNHMPVKYEPF